MVMFGQLIKKLLLATLQKRPLTGALENESFWTSTAA